MAKILTESRILTGTSNQLLIDHIDGNGSDHSFINQDVTTNGTPSFISVNTSNLYVDFITEKTSGAGITICGINNEIIFDTITSKSGTDITVNNGMDISNNRLTGLVLTPIYNDEAASKNYVDTVKSGLDPKESVRAASTANLNLTTDFQSGNTIDGITLITGNRILIKDQSNGIQNGIYIVQSSGTPNRSSDFAVGANVASSYTFVEEGLSQADQAFLCTNNQGSDVVGTDILVFTIFSPAIIAGNGLTLTGSTLDVGAGSGIISNANDIEVNVDGITIEIINDALQANISSLAGAGLIENGQGISINVDNTTIEIINDSIQANISSLAGAGLIENGQGISINVDNTTIEIVDDSIQANISSLAGNGLIENGQGISVNVDNITIEIVDDSIQANISSLAGEALIADGQGIGVNVDNITIEIIDDSIQANISSLAGAALIADGQGLGVNVDNVTMTITNGALTANVGTSLIAGNNITIVDDYVSVNLGRNTHYVNSVTELTTVLNGILALPTPSRILMAPGDYTISSTLTIPENCVLQGSSSNNTVLITPSALNPMISANNNNRFESLKIDNRGTTTDGIDIQDVDKLTIKDVIFTNTQQTFVYLNTSVSSNITIESCNFNESTFTGLSTGIWNNSIASENIVIKDCVFDNIQYPMFFEQQVDIQVLDSRLMGCNESMRFTSRESTKLYNTEIIECGAAVGVGLEINTTNTSNAIVECINCLIETTRAVVQDAGGNKPMNLVCRGTTLKSTITTGITRFEVDFDDNDSMVSITDCSIYRTRGLDIIRFTGTGLIQGSINNNRFFDIGTPNPSDTREILRFDNPTKLNVINNHHPSASGSLNFNTPSGDQNRYIDNYIERSYDAANTIPSYTSKVFADTTSGAFTLNAEDLNEYSSGYKLYVELDVDGGDLTLSPNSFTANSSVIFTNAGEYAILEWCGTEWDLICSNFNTTRVVSSKNNGEMLLQARNSQLIPFNDSGNINLSTNFQTNTSIIGALNFLSSPDITNKNLVDTSVFIVDASDNTIRIGFDAAGSTSTTTTLTSSQTVNRTLTLPDATDSLVARATTDTLTNKTIVAVNNNVASDALKANSGNILVRLVDASEPIAGQVLTATSNTTATWQTPVANTIINLSNTVIGVTNIDSIDSRRQHIISSGNNQYIFNGVYVIKPNTTATKTNFTFDLPNFTSFNSNLDVTVHASGYTANNTLDEGLNNVFGRGNSDGTNGNVLVSFTSTSDSPNLDHVLQVTTFYSTDN